MTLFEFLYYMGYSAKKKNALHHQKRLPHKVISIGNITVGGTGKTPAAIAIAEEAKKRGFNPVILTRGYKGKAEGPCLVQSTEDRGQKTGGSALLYGDEPVLMAGKLKDVPIVKCVDRYQGGLFALRNLTGDGRPFIFILDDGFQHWKLYRDMDVVLIDGSNPFGNRRMLPLGPLRGPLRELERAGIFVITKKRNEGLAGELKRINPSAPICFSGYRTIGAKDAGGNIISVDSLKGKSVYAFCGLANPESFRQTLLSLGCTIGGFKAYRDHHRYTDGDVLHLQKQCKSLNCKFMITTEKDMVKLQGLETPENLLCLEIDFEAGKEFFEKVFDSV